MPNTTRLLSSDSFRNIGVWLGGRRLTLAALLFLSSLAIGIGSDLRDLYWYVGFVSSVVGMYASDHVDVPHFQYHALVPSTGLSLAIVGMAVPLALGPFRRGERWARWVLALATFGYLAIKVWGSLTLYPHPASIAVMALPAVAAIVLTLVR